MTLLQFPTESNSETILTTGQYLVMLWARVRCLVFLTHGVVLECIRLRRSESRPYLDSFTKAKFNAAAGFGGTYVEYQSWLELDAVDCGCAAQTVRL